MYTENYIEKIIANYLSGNTTPEETAFLTAWVQESSENLRHYYQIRNIWQITHPAFNPDDIKLADAHLSVINKIKQQKRLSSISILLKYWQRFAAIILLPVLLFSIYSWTEKRSIPKEMATYQELTAPYGTLSKVILPDGSKVWLNSGSYLKYPVRFPKGQRNVQLKGEGYFEVQSDKKNPFIVETAQMQLIATGTQFNVEAYATDSITAVTMVSGQINVVFGNSKPIAIEPNKRACYNKQKQKTLFTNTDPYKWCAWKDGLMVFRDDPLAYVFKRLSQTFNVEINIKDPTIADDYYRATFSNESLNEILLLLEKTAPIQFVYHKRVQTSDNLYEKQKIDVYKKK
ncbi:FecR family protein [Parabacteroides sp.]